MGGGRWEGLGGRRFVGWLFGIEIGLSSHSNKSSSRASLMQMKRLIEIDITTLKYTLSRIYLLFGSR